MLNKQQNITGSQIYYDQTPHPQTPHPCTPDKWFELLLDVAAFSNQAMLMLCMLVVAVLPSSVCLPLRDAHGLHDCCLCSPVVYSVWWSPGSMYQGGKFDLSLDVAPPTDPPPRYTLRRWGVTWCSIRRFARDVYAKLYPGLGVRVRDNSIRVARRET